MYKPTPRERDVIAALIEGHNTDREIASYLGIQPATVGRHWANIFAKSGMNRRVQVALWWLAQRHERRPERTAERVEVTQP